MSTWERAECRPGSEASLDALYALVPVAEEVDLAEGLHAEQFARWAESVVLGRPRDPDDQLADEADGQTASGDARNNDSPTPGQAIGLLEHLLGAVPIEE